MKLRQRSQIALASSITIHILLLVVLSIMGAFSVLDKKSAPVEIVFFDSVNAGGSGASGGGSAAMPKNQQQAAVPTNTPDAQAIADTMSKPQTYTPPIGSGISADTTATESVGSGTDGGTGAGAGAGSGTGSGSGTGTGDGVGSGSGSGISSNPAVPPRVTRYVAPEYPSTARSAGITGVVRLQVLINSSGDVQDVQVYESSGTQSLDNSAIRAVHSWQFTAAKDNAGRRVACYSIVPIRFNLKN